MNIADKHAEAIVADPRWARILARDKTADGEFKYTVDTTGIYCRPSCPSRGCNPKNVTIHDTVESAQATGFRACNPRRRTSSGRAATLTSSWQRCAVLGLKGEIVNALPG